MQSVCAVAPVVFWYVLMGHSAQSLTPLPFSCARYVPLGHCFVVGFGGQGEQRVVFHGLSGGRGVVMCRGWVERPGGVRCFGQFRLTYLALRVASQPDVTQGPIDEAVRHLSPIHIPYTFARKWPTDAHVPSCCVVLPLSLVYVKEL